MTLHEAGSGDSLLRQAGESGGKRAIVLAGGGIASAVFEIGCLRALDDFFTNTSTTDFDIFVGVSAGALISSGLAGGIPSDEMFKSLIGASATLDSFTRQTVFRLNREEILHKLTRLPLTYYNTVSRFLKSGGDLTLSEAILSMTEVLPTALFEGSGLEEYVRHVISTSGRPDSFRALEKKLLIPAVNLDTGETRIFGKGDDLDVPLSLAVKASMALPGFFKPVRIGNNDYVDGAVDQNCNIEAAVEEGARLVICVNPYVPIYNDPRNLSVPLASGRAGYLSQKGIVGVMDQVFRIMTHNRLQVEFVELMRRHPDVDVITFQPARNDYRMFFYNAMRFSARIVLAEYGFVSTKKAIDQSFDGMSEVFGRHGIALSPVLVNKEYDAMRRSRFSLDSVVKTLGTVPFLRKKKEIA
jgi:predicted acylesterase/phospholipase RssA